MGLVTDREYGVEFDVGYFEGKQSKTKRLLVNSDDLDQMYTKHKGVEIFLWSELECDDHVELET